MMTLIRLRLSVACGNDTLQILIMVIRRHMVGIAVHVVSNTVIADIRQVINRSLPRMVSPICSLCLTAAEAGYVPTFTR